MSINSLSVGDLVDASDVLEEVPVKATITIDGREYPRPGDRANVLNSTLQPVKPIGGGRFEVLSQTPMSVADCYRNRVEEACAV